MPSNFNYDSRIILYVELSKRMIAKNCFQKKFGTHAILSYQRDTIQ